MIKIPVLSKTESFIHAVEVMVAEYPDFYDYIVFDSIEQLDVYTRTNLPELTLLDLTDSSLDGEKYYESMKGDPLYRFGGVIAVVSDEGARMALEMEPNPCLLLSINEREFLRNSTRLFKILKQNIQFVFNRYIQPEMLIREVGTFICDNDSFDIIIYTNLIITYLGNTGRIDFEGKFLLQTALMEMLLNALEHGNCEINYEDKSAWLVTGKDILELIEERNANPEISSRKIYINYEACADETHFSIRDEGAGFNWREMLKKDIEPDLHGMGIKMTERMVKSLSYNEKGNEVFFSIENANESSFLVMHEFLIKKYNQGDIIKDCKESVDDIYFILDGKMSAQNSSNKSDEFSTSDIFITDSILGTSFSLRAESDTRIMIAKKTDFDSFLSKNPVFTTLTERLAEHSYRQSK